MGKQGQDCHTSNLTQEMVARYIARGYYKEGIDAKCSYYAKKAKLMYELAKKIPAGGDERDQSRGRHVYLGRVAGAV